MTKFEFYDALNKEVEYDIKNNHKMPIETESQRLEYAQELLDSDSISDFVLDEIKEYLRYVPVKDKLKTTLSNKFADRIDDKTLTELVNEILKIRVNEDE